ncbi:MAG: ADP-ribosylglycohydrolase family protein [Anaerolineae bacterium]|nr:ADP-ribosylglycohydrolase family protein [Anaerolineae bacterium]
MSENQYNDLVQRVVSAPRIEGALLGAAIGDALGWPQEMPKMRVDRSAQDIHAPVHLSFQTWKRRAGGRFWSHLEIIEAGEYSDDTQLLLATARSLEHTTDWYRHFCWYELPAWLIYERGGGKATRMAAQRWQKGIPPWRDLGRNEGDLQKYFTAGGNGVAMRILPHSLLQGQTPELLCRQIALNGVATHAHPRALLGARLYGYAAWLVARLVRPLAFGELIDYLLDARQIWGQFPEWTDGYSEWVSAADRAIGGGYPALWLDVVEEVCTGLQTCRAAMSQGALSVDQEVMKQLGCFDRNTSGAGTVGALAAVYLASRYAVDPITGLLEAAFARGSDTDTIACMVGGLLGALCGREWIPGEWIAIQDRQYLLKRADSLAQIRATEDSGFEPRDEVWSERSNAQVLRELDVGTRNVFVGPLGHCLVQDSTEHEPVAKSAVARSWRLLTEEGQTIYIKQLARHQKESRTVPSALLQINTEHQHEPVSNSTQRIALDPGIYVNLFEAFLGEEQAYIMVADRAKYLSLRGLRDQLKAKGLDVWIYAWDDTVFGYGMQAAVLTDLGFAKKMLVLREHPQLTERMILQGYVRSLEQAGYTCEWNKGVTRVYQFGHPLFETQTGVRMYRGFELRGQFLWDAEHEHIAFGIVIDAAFAYRDRADHTLGVADVVARFGSATLRQLRQRQGDLSPRGDINLEISRQRLLQQTLPFLNARHLFTLPCGVRAELAQSPARVVLVDREPDR